MTNTDVYNLGVKLGTRNRRGYFVQDMAYQLVNIEQSGWAFICDTTTCHYVDPDCLQEVPSGLSD